MKFFLYYNFGFCNDGSHLCGLEEFGTYAQAMKRLKELRPTEAGFATIIKGNRRYDEELE